MTGLFAIINTLLAVLLWLLVMRLIVINWGRGGAIVAPFITFVVLLVAYDVVIAAIAVVLLFLFVPTLARSGFGSGLMRILVAVTEPVVELVRRGSGRRVDGGPAVFIAALLVLATRVATLLVLR